MRTLPAFLILALACGSGDSGPEPAAEPDSAAAAEPAPPADLATFVADIRSGIAGLPAEAAADPVAARRRAVDLYATRQETIEAHWGPRGGQSPSPELAQAVLDAEASFHDLLALLNREAAPDSAAVAQAVAALDARQEAVLRAAGATPSGTP